MFVILVYDVNQKRVAKVMKTCRKYLSHKQKSVFEGMITEGKLKQLKTELEHIILHKEDAVCVYKFESLRYASKEEIGVVPEVDNIL